MARDWALEAHRLSTEDCRRHGLSRPKGRRKAQCHDCLTEALGEVYELGRADERAETKPAPSPSRGEEGA